MKKIKICLIFTIILCFIVYFVSKMEVKKVIEYDMEEEEVRGVFVSYIDYKPLLLNSDLEGKKEKIEEIINNVKSFNLNTIFLQVVSFGDVIYKSDIYPVSNNISKNGVLDLDILEYFIKISHENNIKVHVWLNPYRLRNKDEVSSMAKYYSWYDTNKIQDYKGYSYLNPADGEVLELIKSVLVELVSNYDVDGVMYDDYFYPNKTIDLDNYEEYKINNDVTIEDYRKDNIKRLIKETYKTVKDIKKDVLVGISPAGNIENNLNTEYLDIVDILKNEGYIDYVAPQIYYGFLNGSKPYIETSKVWNNLIENETSYYISLALYKSGVEDKYALTGKDEWIDNTDILKRQIVIGRNLSKYKGFIIFRYDYLFNKDKMTSNTKEEVKNLDDLLKINDK